MLLTRKKSTTSSLNRSIIFNEGAVMTPEKQGHPYVNMSKFEIMAVAIVTKALSSAAPGFHLTLERGRFFFRTYYLDKNVSIGGTQMTARTHVRIIVFAAAIAMTTYLNTAFAGTEEAPAGAGQKSTAANILDGKKFKGQTGEVGKKTHHEDLLVFDGGHFTSTECYQFGFKSGPYTATVEQDAIRFKAVTHSPTHGKMEWEGTVRGDTLEVSYSWTKERWLWTTFRKYWFKGTLVQ